MSVAARQDPASAARSAPAVRSISVHLTPYAIGCNNLAHDDDRRWKTWWNLPALDVVRKVLARLRLKPGQIRAARQVNGDIALSLADQSEILIEGDPANDDPAPLALLYGDLTLGDVEAALRDLHRRGWIPSTLNPSLGAVQ